MDFAKKFQYSFILFLICIIIFTTGFWPNLTGLIHRKLLAPEEYAVTHGFISDLVPRSSLEKNDVFDVYVTYTPLNQGHSVTAMMTDFVPGMVKGMEIVIIYHKEDTSLITQESTQFRNALLYGSFVVVSFLVGIMMMHPASEEFHPRKPRTLRERLEIYHK